VFFKPQWVVESAIDRRASLGAKNLMNDLEAIARGLHLPVEALRRPADLLSQGYDPSFLATYRPDELGQLDVKTLAKFRRLLEYQKRIDTYRTKLKEQAINEGWWVDTLQKLIDNSKSIAEIDGLTRNIRSRKSSRVLAERDPKLAKVGQAILTMTGTGPEDLLAWIVAEFGVAVDQAQQTLLQTKTWLAVLLSEDAQLLHQLGQQILRRGQVSMKMLAEPSEKEQALKDATDGEHQVAGSVVSENPFDASSEPLVSDSMEVESSDSNLAKEDISPEGNVDTPPEGNPDVEAIIDSVPLDTHDELVESDSVAPEDATKNDALPENSSESNEAIEPVVVDPLLASFSSAPASRTRFTKGKNPKSSAGLNQKTVSKSPAKPLTPRQRRRKWLRSILQRYSKLRKPLTRLGHYEALMLGRGQRSQIIAMRIEYDLSSMTKLAHDALCSSGHPMEAFLSEVADNSLSKIILPRLEHDVFSELEEAAHHELTELAVQHLQEMIDQRPVRGHRVLLIDAMGPKSAAVAIVDSNGHVDFTGELSSVSSRSDIVTQNVATLGEWIHKYKVTLVAISNGNTRRYLVQTVAELMKQSGEGGDLRWTIVDRTGADAYCETRQALQELPTVSRRHRAAVWLAWRLQDPLIEITKIDPARLRLGSYQRELPQDILETGLEEAVSSSVAARGVDLWNSHEKSLVCLPGIDLPLAQAIVGLRDRAEVSTRDKLVESLKSIASETQIRQAIGYLRVFNSTQPLDGTMIHPDDYRLAERLIATGELSLPPAAPENWSRMGRSNSKSNLVTSEAPEAAPTEKVHVDSASESVDIASESQSTAMHPVEPAVEPAVETTQQGESAKLVESTVEAADHAIQAIPAESESTSEGTTEAASGNIPSFAKPKLESDGSVAGPLPTVVQNVLPAITLAPTNPENPDGPAPLPALTIDIEKLSRSWQVGREKTRFVGRCLQSPFADSRDARMPIPLLTSMPTMESLRPGQSVWGIVIGVAEFGAFMDLGPDCNGLVHVSRLSREFVEDPQEVVQIGDLIQVWVLHVDLEKRRIALSALPPGVEQARRPGTNDATRDDQARGGRNDRNSRDSYSQGGRSSGSNRPGSDSRTGDSRMDGKRPASQQGQAVGQQTTQNSSQPSGQAAGQHSGGGGANRGGSERGPARGGQSRGSQGGGNRDGYGRGNSYRGQSDGRNEVASFNKKQDKPTKPAPPISDAMKQGKEPMRSFSDLIQFMQPKRNDPLPDNSGLDSVQSKTDKPIADLATASELVPPRVNETSASASRPEVVHSDASTGGSVVLQNPDSEKLDSDSPKSEIVRESAE